jgi:hypothetical protein
MVVVSALCLASYCFGMIWVYSLPVWSSDEIAFYKWADLPLANGKQGVWAFLQRPNSAGYGVIYWNMYIILKANFGSNAIWCMRGLALLAWFCIPLSTVVVGNASKKNLGWLLVALWISMPMAWWSGKFTGPETFSVAFAYCGIMVLQFGRLRFRQPTSYRAWGGVILGWVLIGLGVGFKLTMLPAAVFSLIMAYRPRLDVAFLNTKDLMQLAYTAIPSFVLGFIVSNPVLVVDTNVFLGELSKLPRGDAWNWPIAKQTLTNEVWTWDGVFSGGLIQWSFVPVTMFMLVVIAMLIQIRNAFALLAGFFTCWGIIISAGSTLGWYWFGFIPLAVPTLMFSVESSSRYRVICLAIASLAVTNGFLQVNRIREQIISKVWQAQAHEELANLQELLNEIVANHKFDIIVDYSEITWNRGLTFSPGIDAEVVQMSPSFIPGLTDGWEKKAEEQGKAAVERGSSMILADAFLRIVDLAHRGNDGKSILLVISKRLATKQSFADFDRFWKEQIQPKCPQNTLLICRLDLTNTLVLEMLTQSPASD